MIEILIVLSVSVFISLAFGFLYVRLCKKAQQNRFNAFQRIEQGKSAACQTLSFDREAVRQQTLKAIKGCNDNSHLKDERKVHATR